MTKNDMVLPGEKLANSEELLSGEGTFEENGVIWAARVGKYVVDQKNRRAIVKPLTSIPVLVKKGDIVLAEVNSVRSTMVIARIFHVKGKNREQNC